MSGQQLSCAEFAELVTDYIEGALSPADRARANFHLQGCDGCTIYLEQMESVVKLTVAVNYDDVPRETIDRLMGLFEVEKSEG
jgi:hypothetical protein